MNILFTMNRCSNNKLETTDLFGNEQSIICVCVFYYNNFLSRYCTIIPSEVVAFSTRYCDYWNHLYIDDYYYVT